MIDNNTNSLVTRGGPCVKSSMIVVSICTFNNSSYIIAASLGNKRDKSYLFVSNDIVVMPAGSFVGRPPLLGRLQGQRQ